MTFPHPLEIALTHAEDASKRCRWILFIMQITVVLVLAGIWQQADSNWLQLRLNTAQSAVKFLTCSPEQAYRPEDGYPRDKISQLGAQSNSRNREDLDDSFLCSKDKPLAEKEIKQAQKYLKTWHYSLAQAKKNVADLQQMVATRALGVSVPVLGIVFDINDLSVMAGITFAILLSWFSFALRRQDDDIRKLFELAEKADEEENDQKKSDLKMAYDLLAMTQVLTIPPGSSVDSRDVSFLRRLSRLPNLIMWTAVLTQLIVLIDDIATMKRGDDLGVMVSHLETAIASCFSAYILYRTVQCFRLMGKTYQQWSATFSKIHPGAAVTTTRVKVERYKLAWVLLLVVLTVHVFGQQPGLRANVSRLLAHLVDRVIPHLSWISTFGEWLTLYIICPGLALFFWHSFIRPIRAIRLVAWIFSGFILLDVVAHVVDVGFCTGPSNRFDQTMVGFFSLPFVVLAALNIILTLRTDTGKNAGAKTTLG